MPDAEYIYRSIGFFTGYSAANYYCNSNTIRYTNSWEDLKFLLTKWNECFSLLSTKYLDAYEDIN